MRNSLLSCSILLAACVYGCTESPDLAGDDAGGAGGGSSTGASSAGGATSGAATSTGGVGSGGTGGANTEPVFVPCTAHEDCEDNDICTDDICRGDGVCFYQPQNDGTACDDGRACSDGDLCFNQVCRGSSTCAEGQGCSWVTGECISCVNDSDCDDGNQCTTDFCGGEGCENINHTEPCDDGIECTTGDICAAGDCNGQLADNGLCDDSVDCTMDVCDLASGCSNTEADPFCDDGNNCTTGRCEAISGCSQEPTSGSCGVGVDCLTDPRCADGVCIGTDTCDVGNGMYCAVSAAQCVACLDASECDDGVPCTEDLCVNYACENNANNALCEDGDPCTTNTCNGTTCEVAPNTGSCDDGASCTTGDTCTASVCGGTDNGSCSHSLFLSYVDGFGLSAADTFEDGDVVEFVVPLLYGDTASSESEFFSEDGFSGNEDINALHVFADGRMILSTDSDANVSGLGFQHEDLVEVAADGGSATVFMNGNSTLDCSGMMCSAPSVDAVHVVDGTTFVFSVTGSGRFSSPNISIADGDILQSKDGVFSVLLSESAIGYGGNIDAITVNPRNGHWMLSYSNSGELAFNGGPTFSNEDMIELPFGPSGVPFSGPYRLVFDGSAMTDLGGDLSGDLNAASAR